MNQKDSQITRPVVKGHGERARYLTLLPFIRLLTVLILPFISTLISSLDQRNRV